MGRVRQGINIKRAKNKKAKYKVTYIKYTKQKTTKNGTKKYAYVSKRLGKNGS